MFGERPEGCVFAAVESESAGVSYILDVGCFNFSPQKHGDVYSEHHDDGGGSHLVFLKGLWLQANHSLAPTTRPSM